MKLRYTFLLGSAAVLLSGCGGGGGGDATVPVTGNPQQQTENTGATGNTDSTGNSGTTSTSQILCSYSVNEANPTYPSLNSQATWSCNTTQRNLSANGVPNHATGTFPNPDNPNEMKPQSVNVNFPVSPALKGSSTNVMITAYALNGVKFDPNTAGTCTGGNICSLAGNDGSWKIEALGQAVFDFGDDMNHAHVQPGGSYHYHGMPTNLVDKLRGNSTQMVLVGWAMDGFPIYARWGYATATDASSAVITMNSSYRTKATADAGRPSTALYPMGTFSQDYEYVADLGHLDECNGRTGVTPEFPGGTYHYYVTDGFPYVGRCLLGQPIN